MSIEIKLGKIREVTMGHGGYQDAAFGFTFQLGGDGWGVHDFWGAWPFSFKRSEYAKWTDDDRQNENLQAYKKIQELMEAAKVNDLNQLKNIPIETTFDGNLLKSWRILKEVL